MSEADPNRGPRRPNPEELSRVGAALYDMMRANAENFAWSEHVRSERVKAEIISQLSHLEAITHTSVAQHDDGIRALTEAVRRLADDVEDLRAAVQAERAQSTELRSALIERSRTDSAVSSARALIDVHDQLSALMKLEGSSRDIIAGQRANLEQALARLGFEPVRPPEGGVIDGSIRTAVELVPASTLEHSGRIARVIEVGWSSFDRRSDLRLPLVSVFGPSSDVPVPAAPPTRALGPLLPPEPEDFGDVGGTPAFEEFGPLVRNYAPPATSDRVHD